jgi:hypothetical protein
MKAWDYASQGIGRLGERWHPLLYSRALLTWHPRTSFGQDPFQATRPALGIVDYAFLLHSQP